MGMQLPSLINNTAFQNQNPEQYSWMSYSNRLPVLYNQPKLDNPFIKNKTFGDWKKFLSNSNTQSPDFTNSFQQTTRGIQDAFGQAAQTIANSSNSTTAKAASAAINQVGQRVIGSIGNQVASDFGKKVVSEGFKNISGKALSSSVSKGFTGAFKGLNGVGMALSVANQFAPQKQEYSGEKGNLTKGLDNAYDTLSDAVGFIPGFGTAASLIMKGGSLAGKFVNKWGGGTDAMTNTDAILGSSFFNLTPLGLVNGFGGKRANTFDHNTLDDKRDRSYIAGSYNMGFIDDANSKSGKKYGYFSSGARSRANRLIWDANQKAKILNNISQKSQFRNEFGNGTQNINTVDYQKKLQGYQPTYLHAGKKGMKIEEEFIIPDISDFKPIIATEEQVSKFKEGGSFNLIPDGALHARKHHMENAEDLTKKGIPVVDKDGKQQAEIERNEIIFRKEVTDQIEDAMKDGSDEKAIEIGKLLVKEIFHNTQDNTGLIEEITDEKPTVEIEKKENGGALPQLDNLDLTKLNQVEKDTLLQLLLQKASL